MPKKLPSTKKTISQPPDWWDAFQYEADAAGLSLSAWIGDACLFAIGAQHKGKTKVGKLSNRPLASRPKKNGGVM
jgi:hypothetical protein